MADADFFAPGEPARGECSLCVLTNQFLRYMAASETRTVDLKQAAIDLQVRSLVFLRDGASCKQACRALARCLAALRLRSARQAAQARGREFSASFMCLCIMF